MYLPADKQGTDTHNNTETDNHRIINNNTIYTHTKTIHYNINTQYEEYNIVHIIYSMYTHTYTVHVYIVLYLELLYMHPLYCNPVKKQRNEHVHFVFLNLHLFLLSLSLSLSLLLSLCLYYL